MVWRTPRRDLGKNVARISRRFAIPARLYLDFLAGLKPDLQPHVPTNRQAVERYSYLVASAVGLAMAHVFGAIDAPALAAARRLGIAMQLTNILRDVGGDLERGRIYLPADLLARYGLEPDDVRELWARGDGPDSRLSGVLREKTGWTDDHN